MLIKREIIIITYMLQNVEEEHNNIHILLQKQEYPKDNQLEMSLLQLADQRCRNQIPWRSTTHTESKHAKTMDALKHQELLPNFQNSLMDGLSDEKNKGIQ